MFRKVSRYLIAICALLACLYGIRTAWRMGLARTFSEYVEDSSFLPAEYQIYDPGLLSNQALSLSPSDPEAHYARGVALDYDGNATEALKEFERAVALRPKDYKLLIRLGSAREEAGDEAGALAAYYETIRRAPYYAQPRWRLGNMLLRIGRVQEAFAELHRAAESDPTLLPSLIDLAWGVSAGDARVIEDFVQPQTDSWRITLARTFAKRGKAAETVALVRATGSISSDNRNIVINDLINSKHFSEAYEVWSLGRDAKVGGREAGTTAIIDGGFENRINFDDAGFGWQLQRNLKAVNLSLDESAPHTGAKSLRLDWSGDSNPATAVVSQLVLVEPRARYRLRFAARTQELVTGGHPFVVVTDVSSNDAHQLARSGPFPERTNDWQEFTVDFTTGDSTQCVLISLQREPCGSAPCPIFGRVWLDDFSLQKL